MIKKFFQRIALVFFGLVLALVACEGILRIYNPFFFRIKGDNIVLPVNQKYIFKNTKIEGVDKKIVHTKNSIGFRGVPPPENFEDYLTLITVGGSTTECFYLSDDKTWPHDLGELLKGSFRNLWLNNAGFDGNSTFAHKILLTDHIAKIKPKVILFLVGANDAGVNKLSQWDRQYIKGNICFKTWKGFIRSMAAYSEVFDLFLNISRYFRAKAVGVVHVQRHFDEMDLPAIPRDVFYEQKQLNKDLYLREYEVRLRELVKICRDNDIEPVFITQPTISGSEIEVERDGVTKTLDFRGTELELSWEILELYNDVVRGLRLKDNVMVVDLARKMPKKSIYYYDTLHYTNRGAEKVAEIIYRDLKPFLKERFKEYIIE